ncbi:MAG: sigma-54 dependent transcriptional regulator [Candidatus Goldbacteria bacterium]|nr:sigma-54 dependent transcriptional regulator [Candidatus Goldiibacteriota bacterium]
MYKILIVEDERNIRESIEAILSERYDVKTASSGNEALNIITKESFDLLITDIRMPGISGLELLKEFKRLYPDNPVIVITAFTSIQSAVEAMKAGASEYVPKPFSLEEIDIKVRNLLKSKKINEEKKFYEKEKDDIFGEIIGKSPEIEKIKESIKKIAKNDTTVLITGETGTGKELIAWTIHKLSGRIGPFVPVHCAAYARGVIESELFGHEKGSFTGADKLRRGKIEIAENGTLFLDELGDIPLDIQVKLLRVLENRTFERVGGNKQLNTNARIICATNKNLNELVKNGTFREDLYYRINVFPIHIPPLRERKEDILLLAEYFLKKSNSNLKIDNNAKNLLINYNWPGNIRELQNIIERAIVLSENDNLRIDLAMGNINVDLNISDFNLNNGLDKIIEDIEKHIILKTLKENNFSQTKTAKILKINRTTLQYKIQKYKIKDDING